MQRYKLITLVDITRSRASRIETDKLKIGQQANFNTFLQTIGLRSNIDWVQDPVKKDGRLPDPIDGKANHWIWEFDVERQDVFLKDQDPVGHLKDDLHGVPIISNLENSVDISPAAIQTSGNNINTWIEII
jgi:hypothetical protein